MSKLQFCIILIAATVLPLVAQTARVTATPRWPWNGLVDITVFTQGIVNKSGEPALCILQLEGYDNVRKESIGIHTLSFNGGSFGYYNGVFIMSGGITRLVWDASIDYPGLNTASFSIKMAASNVGGEYLVVNLETSSIRFSSASPNLADDMCRTTELWLRWVPAGTFTMGSPEDELGRSSSETQHQVTLTAGYYIGVFEVTQKQWELVMGGNPSNYKGDTRPVERVSYNSIRGSNSGAGWPSGGHAVDDDSFLGKLRAKTGGLLFDLPTEAQWEYACRAGTTTALNSGKNLTGTSSCPNMAEVGRYWYNRSDGKGGYSQHTKVGSYLPNAWGLYDMHGNVYEWCLDWYGDYPTEPVSDPTGAASGSYRVRRGGSWDGSYAQNCRSAYRLSYIPSLSNYSNGFRVVCVPPGQ